ncbi:MAG TPA: sulfatase-like hydrolase/transferase [Armatimonadota bacterium]|nr:sulfatase-like hydrolase/transferase [Armatimonadota bacterium]
MTDSKHTGISRREALSRMGRIAAGAALTPLLGSLGRADSPDGQCRPNILLIEADDLGYGDLGCYDGICSSPYLDKLASEGMRLSHFYVAVPLCAPTRVSLMTGKTPQRTSLIWNPRPMDMEDGLSPDETTIAELLKTAGYHAGLVGKWHLGYGAKFRPRKQGFDEYFGFLSGSAEYFTHEYRGGRSWMFRNDEPYDEPGVYMTDLLTREAVSFINRNASKPQPFFLYLAYNAPHGPIQAPEEWKERFGGDTYKAMVACMDDGIGKVLAAVSRNGIEDNTLVVFFSDNGGVQSAGEDVRGSNSPLSGGKGTLQEGGIRVPMIARWPGKIPAGKVVDVPAISMDLFTTFAAVGGAKPSGNIDGKDMMDVLCGRSESLHKVLFWQCKGQEAARSGELKLLRQEGRPVRLYNVVQDPAEKTDLSAKYPKTVKALSAALDQWLAEVKGRVVQTW